MGIYVRIYIYMWAFTLKNKQNVNTIIVNYGIFFWLLMLLVFFFSNLDTIFLQIKPVQKNILRWFEKSRKKSPFVLKCVRSYKSEQYMHRIKDTA